MFISMNGNFREIQILKKCYNESDQLGMTLSEMTGDI